MFNTASIRSECEKKNESGNEKIFSKRGSNNGSFGFRIFFEILSRKFLYSCELFVLLHDDGIARQAFSTVRSVRISKTLES